MDQLCHYVDLWRDHIFCALVNYSGDVHDVAFLHSGILYLCSLGGLLVPWPSLVTQLHLFGQWKSPLENGRSTLECR